MLRFFSLLWVFLLVSNISLSDEYTPLGALVAGSESGKVPKWIGNTEEIKKVVEKVRHESPLYIINYDNHEKYKTLLSEGQLALLRQYKETYTIPVYPSYRTHIAPDWIYDATKKNQRDTRLADNGIHVENVWPGIPFPFPESAVEVVWNHLLHWRGVSAHWDYFEATVFPNGAKSTVSSEVLLGMPYYEKDRDIIEKNSKIILYRTFIKKPSRLAGGGLLVHESLNADASPRQAWVYVAGQSRLRRLPRFDFDTSMLNSENLRVVDEVDLFNGSPSRYDWTLVGKKEVLVPYNSRILADEITTNREAQLIPKHLLPDNTRFEMHRAWVVEGNLKKGQRHIYPRRTLYIDEDSWIALLSDIYDNQGNLWRTSISHTMFRETLQGIWKTADVYHDLKSEKYYVQSGITKDSSIQDFFKSLPKSEFMPATLRRKARR